MNHIILAHHGGGKSFAFEVPDNMAEGIHKGTNLLVHTKYGLTIATATSGVISGEGADDVAIRNGATLPLKPVLAYLHPLFEQHLRQKIAGEIAGLTPVKHSR